ncbi:hypothetical protein Vau01_016910 [Virgisporangium aurantiacum]|uniref:Uncharacterized protein n=2 Tax=Virgisporangium aurantiacum TaxID=175570 RepID=A0A8J4DX46_9ACTN|nr:hypothetical protein Vau01_016910 [Virgisporangium aurantiacum]
MAAALSLGTLATACSDKPESPGVPTLGGSAGTNASAGAGGNPNAANGDGSAERRTKLHAAAQCIRENGAPNYQDPVLTADGRVYTDEVALRELDEPEREALQTACAELIRAANFGMADQAPPPPAVIRAGVKSAECLRAHGLPNVKDPTASSSFIPGKGFGLNPDELPADGKADPTVQRALTECRSILDEEQRVSSLGNLTNA